MSYTETMLEYVYDQYCLSYNMEDALDFIEDEIDYTGIVFDKEIILHQLKNCIDKIQATSLIINHAPEEFKVDKEIALEAVKNT